jgi:RNA polymerase sigma-70 factor (ECF subfamily)
MALNTRPNPLQDVPDRALVQLITTDGSEDAFRVLHRRHAPRLFAFALRLLGAESDAEDAVQEMWVKAVPQLAGFAWRSALQTWLIAILLNVCRDMLDRRGRWALVELRDEVMSTEHNGHPVDLERAIAALPHACRAVFILHDVEGFTHEEIAERMRIGVGTSKSQVFRARRALRRLLGNPEIEEAARGS